jgi:hypothetical protein
MTNKSSGGIPSDSDKSVEPLRLVKLLRCGRKSCSHVLIEEEKEWRTDPEWAARKTSHCPKCGEVGFYTLNELGQIIKYSQRDEYRNGIDPTKIVPSPRMGLAMKRRILRAKRYALSLTNPSHS